METRTKRTWIAVAVIVVLVAIGGALVAARLFGGDPAPEAALSSPSVSISTEPSGTAAEGFDGTWSVDTATALSDGSATFAGYRIDEELANVGTNTAVGRTSDVTGSMTIEGEEVTALEITVDMTTLVSDDDRRDGQLAERGLETGAFPPATFVLTEAIQVGEVPAAGEPVEATATGELTLHGVTNTVEVPIQAQWTGDVIEVVAAVDVALADHGIEAPVGFLVLSVADTGTIELHLLFRQG
jgi:polyisoprenoid-binding protein YceI